MREAYAARAGEYIAVLGSVEATAGNDRALIARWAAGLTGSAVDVGCGPGHWTEFLRCRGVAVEGVDLVPEFVTSAQARFPDASFRVGSLLELDADLDALGGILAWYSLIHLAPAELPGAIAALSTRLRPGGSLLLGFFEGPRTEVFAHAVTPAWFHPLETLRLLAEEAGLDVIHTARRGAPGMRDHGELIAVRR